MLSKTHFGGLPEGQVKEKTFLIASRRPQGPLLGSHFGVEKRSKLGPRNVCKTHVTSNTVLERFWITLESDFEANFEVSTL